MKFPRIVLAAVLPPLLLGQEASFGVAVPMTFSAQAIHTHRADPSGGDSPFAGGLRAVFYPSVKLGEHWFGYSAIQVNRTPFLFEEASSPIRQTEASVVQAYIGYSRVGKDRAITVKAGQLTSAFGSYPLRYDDSRNALIDVPLSYGEYYVPVSLYGIPGAEIDVVYRGLDARVQFTNSSPTNPRKLWQSDQYGTWTAGAGYAIRQGLRVGASMYQGPYLDRNHRFFRPNEIRPKDLPALAYGIDVQAAKGRWTVSGELQRFQMSYVAVPYFFNSVAYAEAKYTLTPRWYVAARGGSRWRTSNLGRDDRWEAVAGFRPAPRHLIKFGYECVHWKFSPGTRDNIAAIQYVVQVQPPAWAIR
ncbi:MAG: hypothetical protein ABI972_03155 [Acidobacteriota bacterium]